MDEQATPQAAPEVAPAAEPMDAGQASTAPEQANEAQASEAAAQEPKDLGEAFAQVLADNEAGAAEAVQETNSNAEAGGQPDANQGQQNPQGFDNPAGAQEPAANANVQGTTQAGSNEQATNQQPGDNTAQYNAAAQRQYEEQLTAQIKNAAYNDAVNEMVEKKILQRDNSGRVKRMSLQDLQYVDEQNERILWRNPHAKNEPFTTMKEATDFVNAFNSQVDNQIKEIAGQRMQQYVRRAQPSVELRKFASVYNSMSPAEQAVASILTQDKAILGGRDGKQVVGFNVNYGNLQKQTKAIVEMIRGLDNGSIKSDGQGGYVAGNTQQQQQPQGSEPALDSNTSNGSPIKEIRPEQVTNYAEAFKFLAQEDAKKMKSGI